MASSYSTILQTRNSIVEAGFEEHQADALMIAIDDVAGDRTEETLLKAKKGLLEAGLEGDRINAILKVVCILRDDRLKRNGMLDVSNNAQ